MVLSAYVKHQSADSLGVGMSSPAVLPFVAGDIKTGLQRSHSREVCRLGRMLAWKCRDERGGLGRLSRASVGSAVTCMQPLFQSDIHQQHHWPIAQPVLSQGCPVCRQASRWTIPSHMELHTGPVLPVRSAEDRHHQCLRHLQSGCETPPEGAELPRNCRGSGFLQLVRAGASNGFQPRILPPL